MTKTLKKEYQPGGSKRQFILDKAVEYLLDKTLTSSQSYRRDYLMTNLMFTDTEYLEVLNKATNGGVEAWAKYETDSGASHVVCRHLRSLYMM